MIPQLVVGGLAVGALYSLIAIGFSLLWQTSRTINFAQGEFIAVPAFVMLVLLNVLSMPFAIALILAVLISVFILGFLVRRTLVQRLIEEGVLPLVVATIALSILLRNSLIFYNSESIPFPSIVSREPIRFAGAVFSSLDVLNIVFAALVIIGLQLFIRRTKLGKAMQAVAQNRETAGILGIDVPKVITVVFVINASLAAIAAMLIAPIYFAKYNMGVTLGLRAFYAAIIGGFNQVRGALIGGLLVGLIEIFAAVYAPPGYKEIFLLVILIGVILFKPEGLLGTKEMEGV